MRCFRPLASMVLSALAALALPLPATAAPDAPATSVPAINVSATSVPAAESGITLTAENTQKAGWMAGGWGRYRFVLKNDTDTPATLTHWAARWEVRGEATGEPWGADLKDTIPAHGSFTKDEVGYLPPEVAGKAKPGNAVMAGTFTVMRDGTTVELPFRVEIPTAPPLGPMRLIRGKTLGLELKEERFRNFPGQKKLLSWLDQAYQAMIDLTGTRPYDGKLMIIRESPEHPYWAYAGNPVVWNTRFVADTLKAANKGLLPFGLIHEVGHNFDVYGPWYIWNGASAEFQANFKLAYAVEHINDPSARLDLRGYHGHAYPPPPEGAAIVDPRHFIDGFFLLFGDRYLADPKRTWDTMSSDELHSFFQRLQRLYGWEPFRAMYRTYWRLDNTGQKPPETPEEKITLMAAILGNETGVDLVPSFQLWRMPVTEDGVKAMRDKYAIGK